MGVRGILRPNQFDDFYLLSRKRNFLPYYIYGGNIKDEFYLQVFGQILSGIKEKPIWLDEGNVHIYIREFKDEDEIKFFIEFHTKKENCAEKQVN